MTGHPRWNGGGVRVPPRVYVCLALVQLILLGAALLTRHWDVGDTLPGLLRAGAALLGVGFALTLGVDRGRYLFGRPRPSRLAWAWFSLSVLCTVLVLLLPGRR